MPVRLPRPAAAPPGSKEGNDGRASSFSMLQIRALSSTIASPSAARGTQTVDSSKVRKKCRTMRGLSRPLSPARFLIHFLVSGRESQIMYMGCRPDKTHGVAIRQNARYFAYPAYKHRSGGQQIRDGAHADRLPGSHCSTGALR